MDLWLAHGLPWRNLAMLRATTTRPRSSVVVSITDTGAGIPADIRTRIFDPFFTTKDVGKGTGQGLGIARAVIVDKHVGDISFDTEVGKGTTFQIRLPIAGRVDEACSAA